MAAVNDSERSEMPEGGDASRHIVGDIRALGDASTRFLQSAGGDPLATLVAGDILGIQRALSRSAATQDAHGIRDAAAPAGEGGADAPQPPCEP
ncbi:hypothetical protein [Ramlibacter humi]|uniref:Uncharacterized protein n=1 Tax=Ramlibacter humi TaxID=2530451 RepID=A0A4Z0BCS6_9BURK|nr:hypothetical protein [Ramlibacter humi]TFY97042.1 hypothetical protein EZ216_19450 [Ramlibacter humi]